MTAQVPEVKRHYSNCAEIEPNYYPHLKSEAGKQWEKVLNSLIDLGEELKAMNKTMITKADLAKATDQMKMITKADLAKAADQMKADLARHMRPLVSKKHNVISKKKN